MIRCQAPLLFQLSIGFTLLLGGPHRALAAPPLTDAQKEQLSTATDRAKVDEGALYPLLRNSAKWDPTDERGAAIPDYEQLNKNPAQHRGDVFLIEGVVARQRVRSLARANSEVWGESLIEWVIKTSPDPEDVVVVFFVDPEMSMIGHAPEPGQRVRLAARFYKVWTEQQTFERKGRQITRPVSFLVFISPGASRGEAPGRFIGSPEPNAGGEGQGAMLPANYSTAMLVIIILIIAVGFVMYRLRRMSGQPALPPSQRLAAQRTRGTSESRHDEEDEVQWRDDLPENPAEAMNVLSTEHDEYASEQETELPPDPADALGESERYDS